MSFIPPGREEITICCVGCDAELYANKLTGSGEQRVKKLGRKMRRHGWKMVEFSDEFKGFPPMTGLFMCKDCVEVYVHERLPAERTFIQ